MSSRQWIFVATSHSIIPVFTSSHLNHHHATKSTHATLVSQAKKIEGLFDNVIVVKKLNGTRGNAGGRGGRGSGGRGC
jgi:hypothetical protein